MRMAGWILVTTVAAAAGACATSPPPPTLPGPALDKANAFFASEPESRAARAAAPLPAGQQEALTLIRESQVNPLAKDDPRVLGVFRWIHEGRLDVLACIELVPELDVRRHPRHRLLLRQVTLAQAAYQIQHPQVQPTAEPVFTAGLSAAVQAYRKLVVAHPEDREPAWDDIDFAERTNRLGRLVQKARASCVFGR
jgi:hypothetical protein